MSNIDFESLARAVYFFKEGQDIAQIMRDHKVIFRKNKGNQHVNKATQKALKMGRAKTETELDFLEYYLTEVFKPASQRTIDQWKKEGLIK